MNKHQLNLECGWHLDRWGYEYVYLWNEKTDKTVKLRVPKLVREIIRSAVAHKKREVLDSIQHALKGDML